MQINTSNGFQEDGPIPYTRFSQTDFRKKRCQGFRKTHMHNGGRVIFAFLNLRARIKIRVSTVDTNHSITNSTQTINRCFDPDVSWFCGQVRQHSSPETVDVSDETIRLSISLRLAVDFLHVTYIKVMKCWYSVLYLTCCGQVGFPQEFLPLF